LSGDNLLKFTKISQISPCNHCIVLSYVICSCYLFWKLSFTVKPRIYYLIPHNFLLHLGLLFASVRSQGSSVSILSDCGLDDEVIEVQSPSEAKDFSSSLCVQTGSGAHAASSPVGTGGPFLRGKMWPGRDADHSPPSSA
jgi:hypothetical protein